MLAVAQEIPLTNSALSPSLDRLLLAGRDEERWACFAATALQGLALTRQHLCPAGSEHTDSNTAFRVGLAAVAMVDSGCKASFRSLPEASLFMHSLAEALTYLNALSGRHAQALQVLRATTFKPGVVYACIKKALTRPGPTAEEEEGEGGIHGLAAVLCCAVKRCKPSIELDLLPTVQT